jgi:hypothetical protein
MRNESFHLPFDKIFRRTFIVLNKMGYIVSSVNAEQEIIVAKKQGNLFSAKATLEIVVRKSDENNSSINVTAKERRNIFSRTYKGVSEQEDEFIAMVTSHI